MISENPDPERPPDNIGANPPIGAKQHAVAVQLRALDPALEGLYLQGLILSRQPNTPGWAYLLAHAGRELSRGVIRQLSGGKPDLVVTPEAIGHDSDDTERNRSRIAAVLEVSPTDTVVNDWFRAVATFSDNCHYQNDPALPAEIATAFDLLNRLLFAVLTPYFDATPEVDRLLAVVTPSDEDINSLRSVLARRGLRARFFRSVAEPGWAPHLRELGIFDNPPDVVTNPDGSWQTAQWLPGQYLIAVAATLPELVTELLLKIPRTNTNPSVWRVAAKAALVVPAAQAAQIARHLTATINSSSTAVFARDVVPFAEHCVFRPS